MEKKKLIEVALPLEAINAASAREKSIRHGHPSNLHLWWARRPLVSARAVIWASLVDDPSCHPELFATEEIQTKERARLFGILEQLVLLENSNDETIYTSQICFNTSSHLKLYGRGNFVLFSRVVFDRILKASELYPYGGNKDLYIDDFVIANQLEKFYFDNEPLKQSIDYIKQIPYLQNEKAATSTYNFELFKDKIGINLRCFRRENIEKYMKQVHKHIKEETKEFVCSNEFNKGIVVFFDDDHLTSKGMSYATMKNYLYEKGIYKEELDDIDESKVSIVIPLYNAEKYISETIDSVLNQKYENWECIIVNDGSTDNSEKIVLEKIKGNDKFKYLSQKNSGPGKARNYGASMASGKYLLFLDADDIILDDYFLDGVNFLDTNANYSLFYGKANIFWDNGTEKLWPLRKFRDMKDFLKSNCIYCTAMIRKKDFDEVGGIDEDLKAFEDWEFFIRLLDRNPKVFREDKILFKYRRHTGSRDDINGKKWIEIKEIVKAKDKDIFDKWNNLENLNDIRQNQTKGEGNPKDLENTKTNVNVKVNSALRGRNGRIPSKNPGVSNAFIKSQKQIRMSKYGRFK